MYSLLALLAFVAPALAVPCGSNFTITPAADQTYCLDATYSTGFAVTKKCDGSAGQKWQWDGLKIYNYVGPANNRACLTFSPFNTQTWITGQVGLQGCSDPTAGKRNEWMENSQQQLVLNTKVESETVVLDLRDGKLNGGTAQVYRQTPGNLNQKWILRVV